MFNLNFSKQPNFDNFGHLYIVHGLLPKITKIWSHDFITSFERVPFKLSEKQKILEIEHFQQKLWLLEDLYTSNYKQDTIIATA